MDFLLKLVVGMTVLATIAAVNEGDGDLVKMFAKERKEMREEQKEMRADFRRENDEQNRVIAEQKKQNDKQNRVIAEQKEEMKSLHNKNDKQSQEIQELHMRLHQADLKNKEAHRQRDGKESKELEAKISSAIRQERQSSELEDVVESVVKRSIRHSGKNNTNSSLEIELKKLMDHQIDQYLIKQRSSLEIQLKKLMDHQIDQYLINQRICVAGKYGHGRGQHTQTVNFGYEFPRTPAVSASLAYVWNDAGSRLYMQVGVTSVTRSSAIINSKAYYGSAADLNVSWLACL